MIMSAFLLLILAGCIRAIQEKDGYYIFLNVPIVILLFYNAIRHLKKIRSVSYDESAIYYVRNGYEVQVLFEKIKSIEIKSLDGVYEMKFHTPTQDGKILFFKTSLSYPLNFQKKDAAVNVLRDKIDDYKRSAIIEHDDQLPSYSL